MAQCAKKKKGPVALYTQRTQQNFFILLQKENNLTLAEEPRLVLGLARRTMGRLKSGSLAWLIAQWSASSSGAFLVAAAARLVQGEDPTPTKMGEKGKL